ncbi:MAG: protoheme IX farnesyltransferase [Betaproteobacteria bacterium]|nr:protoheme IX farnesyltransferase [Betaproteobacteria bacterium]
MAATSGLIAAQAGIQSPGTARLLARPGAALRQWAGLFKLRIGAVIAFTALAGLAVAPGRAVAWWEITMLGLSVLVASAAAGAFNQYYEVDLDRRMRRTRGRPFATGALRAGPVWLALIVLMLGGAVAAAALALNVSAALYVFLGAFFYAIVYTVWLKRRTWLNIVVGGLAGSFAVLAGAATVGVESAPVAIALAAVLFLWTPSHFWCLAIACREDYEAAGVPMLPVLIGDARTARVILGNTTALVAASLAPLAFGMGWIYAAGAASGGALFLARNVALVRDPGRVSAMRCFHASLAQLTLVLASAMLDRAVAG